MRGISIKYQLRLATLIPVLVVAVLFAFFYNNEFDKTLNHQTSRLGEAYVRQLLPAAELAMMRNDRRTLQGLINASTINPEVKALAFYDAEGNLMAYRGGKHSLHQPFTPPAFTGDFIEKKTIPPYTIHFVAPITIPKFNLYSGASFNSSPNFMLLQPDDILGWLSIDINTQSMMIKRYQMYIITIFTTLLGLLISLTIHHYLSRRIYRPIMRLRRSMKQISSNAFETHISAKSPAEFGDIERGCVHLQKKYLNTVHDLNHHIEVATADLQQGLEFLEEKNIELSLDKKKSDEKSRQKSEFIANMSHEIRTPMNGVIGFTNVLLETKLDPLQLDYVKTIKTSAQDLLNIISDILDYSKMEAGKLHLDCIPLDLRACIDEVLTLAAPNAYKKGIDLIPSTETRVPKTVLGDPLRIKQLLSNLVNNSIKFTDQGYVLVRTNIEQETDKDYLLSIAIHDTGIGISSEDQTKLFNAFNQADTSITRRYGGTGLGLVICKKLAEAMDGRIALHSEPHKGSTFTITLKLEKLAAYEVEKSQNQRFAQLKALCFADNAIQLEALCNGIGFLGLQCVPISTLSQLSAAFRENKDSSIAFININEGSEKQIARILKKQSIPSVIVSKRLIPDSHALGAKKSLIKPVSIQKLYDSISELVSQPLEPMKQDHELDNLRQQLRLIHPNVLIAEDNPLNRMLLSALFQGQATIDIVEDGEEAILASRSKHFHLLLFDMQMPKFNGLEAALHIRQSSIFNRLSPIVVISANTTDISADELTKAGIDLCLQKPIEEKQFLTQILKIINKSKKSAIDWPLCVQKVSGNLLLAQDYLNGFIKELRENRTHFIHLFNNKEVKNLEIAAHKLHGACCFCGVPLLQTHVMRLEKYAKEGQSIDQLSPIFSEFIQSIDEVIDEFDKRYRGKS